MKVLACATQGKGSDDEVRLSALVSRLEPTLFGFDKRHKWANALQLLRQLRSRQFDLLVLEGSGVAGGLPALCARLLWAMPYVVSSGDAIGPYLAARHPIGRLLFSLYERTLCAQASGFIGWTPYLAGRALTYGAPRAITIPGWAPLVVDKNELLRARIKIRMDLNIAEGATVFGLVGSLNWSKRYQYCYGAELVRAAKLAKGAACVLIVGDGSGLPYLRDLAEYALGSTVFLPGKIARADVPSYLAAMDIGSLPQSVDNVGNFRYTTKLSEYRAVGLPVVVNRTPMAYDLDDGTFWRLPGDTPWDPVFVAALAGLMKSLTQEDIARRRRVGAGDALFDKQSQVDRATAFLTELGQRNA